MVILAVGIVCSHRGSAMELAPIDWSGQIGLLLRTSLPENGDNTFHQAYTAELMGRSIVWEPWFGDWRARLAASKSLTDTTTDQDSTILSGDGQLRLFPRSRFPFEAFFDAQDTRVDLDSEDQLGSDSRFVRFGMRQRYQSLLGDVYNATLVRDHREDLISGQRDTSNRAILSGFLQRGAHQINGAFLANDTRSTGGDIRGDDGGSFGGSDQLDWQLDVSDSYAPSPRLSLLTTGTLGYRDADLTDDSIETRLARVSSQLLWRSDDLPLRARGNFFSETQRTNAVVSGDQEQDEVRGIVNLTYLPTPRWRLGLDLGASTRAGEVDETRTIQGATVNYSSLAIPLRQFAYTYGAGAGASNETNSRTGAEQVYIANLLHDLNRSWLFSWGVPVAMGLTIGQEVRGEEDTSLGTLGTLVHRVSWNLSSQSSSAQLIAQDTRESGRSDRTLQTLSLNGVHVRRLSRFSDFAANFNVNLIRQSGSAAINDEEDREPIPDPGPDGGLLDLQDDGTEKGQSSSLEVTYRHNRVLQVRNLWFQSRLRLSADSLLVSDFAGSEEDNGELLWENRLEYFIGKLEVRFRTALIERSGDNDGNKIAILSITRRF